MHRLCSGLILALGFYLSFVGSAQAALIDRGVFDGVSLIYDTDLDVTWLGDANYAKTSGFDADGRMDWNTATAWVASLTIGGFTDWRLPVADPSCGLNSFNCTSNELGHLFYTELGNMPGFVHNLGPFINVQNQHYWTGTEPTSNPIGAWFFNFGSGEQHTLNKNGEIFVWVLRSGDVTPIPEPATWGLWSLGISGLIVYAWRRPALR